ncbi:MAG TPA: BREX system P-loop protein BrxC [Verrucomicrobiota bacterium]|nr:BREX system P-loop protein BrxC [Verrucomicrobiota bacterium]HPK99100.1 BREX system P-loop protein BrxC [Verrucomicrobiota bacterium]HQK01744.1 BREX system P-loop protein BrxC [Verrucomicrobiota bacterium]
MKTIAELFERPVDRTIEEVIKVDQANEAAVRSEIDEYIVTDSIRGQFQEVYREIAGGPAAPREGIGIWVSGFFGSGKSSFAKILGYTVANRKVGAAAAADLFKKTLQDAAVGALLDNINTRIPFHAVIFDVSMDRGVRTANDRLTEIMYRALLRELGYAEDFDLAELEIALEGDGRLKQFEDEFKKQHGGEWRKRRQLGLAINEASAVLNKLDPKTYPTAESYAMATGQGRADVDPNKLARRAFDLTARRYPGKALIFIIDEVGQYVSRSVDKMLDLQAIIQAFGVEGKNRTERHEAVSPFWIVVTSQEKLNEVVTALDSKRIELARLQDRFRLPVDLKQSDIAEVTSKRVLEKKKAATELLQKRFDEHEPRIQQCCTLERTSRNLEINRNNFAKLYPYLPYQIDLCIDVVAGLRLKRGAHRHVGGSNRTIIKQAQQMMINDRTKLADAPIGTLVTLDKVYELLYLGNLLPTETTREVDEIAQRLPKVPMAPKVAKAIALLESVKDLPRTPHNLAVVLHPTVDAQPVIKEVEAALKALEASQFVRLTEEGYKLLTVQEKNWDTKRNSLDPREADRNRIHRELIKEIFDDPKLQAYRYNDLRRFRASLNVDGEAVDPDGDVALNLTLTTMEEQAATVNEARDESVARQTELFWVATLTDEILTLVTELFRSREMVSEYDRLGAQQRLTSEEASCLSDEKSRRDRVQKNLRNKLLLSLEGGVTFFRGAQTDATTLGKTLTEALHGLLDRAVPVLYPKLEIGVLQLQGDEPDKLLTSANLNGLPQVFYHDQPERSLVVKQSGRFVPNLGSDLCREILEYLRREHGYGNRVTGKTLESHFSGLNYGWERESIRLGLAILFRGGSVEVTHQGRKYRNYTEPASRPPFVNNPAFRAASFSPREALDLKVLANAARMYEEITGKDVDIEEGAIAVAFKQVAAADREKLLPLSARLSALRLPGADLVKQQLDRVEGIAEMPPDDCVKTLASEGKAYQENRKKTGLLEKAATNENIQAIERAQRVLNEQWPVLADRQPDDDATKAAKDLRELLKSEDALAQIEAIGQNAEVIAAGYRTLYQKAFENRKSAYTEARDQIKGRPEWLEVDNDTDITPEQKAMLLQPLSARADAELDLPSGATVCRKTGATLGQLETDIDAVEGIARGVLKRILDLIAPEEKIERVVIGRLYPGRITNQAELDQFINDLKDRLSKILAQGGTIILG